VHVPGIPMNCHLICLFNLKDKVKYLEGKCFN
jgi:hypothetical protein